MWTLRVSIFRAQENTFARKSINKFCFSLAYSYLCRQNDKTKDIMRRILTLAVTALAALINIEAAQTIKAPKGGKAISDELLGIFFEDISYAADGGIYAELVQNGSFEYNPTERDGWGPGTSWRFVRPGHSLGRMEPRMDNPLHPNNPTYMRLYIERVGPSPFSCAMSRETTRKFESFWLSQDVPQSFWQTRQSWRR